MKKNEKAWFSTIFGHVHKRVDKREHIYCNPHLIRGREKREANLDSKDTKEHQR